MEGGEERCNAAFTGDKSWPGRMSPNDPSAAVLDRLLGEGYASGKYHRTACRSGQRAYALYLFPPLGNTTDSNSRAPDISSCTNEHSMPVYSTKAVEQAMVEVSLVASVRQHRKSLHPPPHYTSSQPSPPAPASHYQFPPFPPFPLLLPISTAKIGKGRKQGTGQRLKQ